MAESFRPFAVVEDEGYKRLMKTGRPECYIPSRSTVSRDVKSTFVKTRADGFVRSPKTCAASWLAGPQNLTPTTTQQGMPRAQGTQRATESVVICITRGYSVLIVPDRSDIRIATNELGQCETASVRENASGFTQVFSGLFAEVLRL